MNRYFRIVAMVSLLALMTLEQELLASQPPASGAELAERLAAAVRKKDKAAISDLYAWDGVSKEMRAQVEKVLIDELLMKQSIGAVKALPTPTNFSSKVTAKGIT